MPQALYVAPFRPHRLCVPDRVRTLDPERAREDILHRRFGTYDGFSILTTPAESVGGFVAGTPRDDTAFKVYTDGKQLLVAVALINSRPRGMHRFGQPGDETCEIFFDPYLDRIGYFQFILNPDGSSQTLTHLPYAEAHSTAFPHLRLRRFETRFEQLSGSYSDYRATWMFAWFDVKDVFRSTQTPGAVGFNVCRSRPDLGENSSWNYCGGNAFQDASAFGTLYLREPRPWIEGAVAELDGRVFRANGGFVRHDGCGPRPTFEVGTPTGERLPLRVTWNKSYRVWNAEAEVASAPPGRYRLYAFLAGQRIEPELLMFDLPGESDVSPRRRSIRRRPFRITVTDDPPMDIIAHHFTPTTLRHEMELFRSWGVDEIHWIDYGRWPSFWNYFGAGAAWGEHWPANVRACGEDFLACVAEQAHAAGLTILSSQKTYDYGFNTFACEPNYAGVVYDLDNVPLPVIPEMSEHPEWALATSALWRRGGASKARPLATLRVYSETPLPRIQAADVTLRVSDDNKTFRPFRGRGRFGVRQRKVRRPHQRWTPAGKVRDGGSATNWLIELTGLRIPQRYVLVEVRGERVRARHRPYMLIEALDAAGDELAHTAATAGGRNGQPLSFGKSWPGWNNVTEPLFEPRDWDLGALGIALAEQPSLPTMHEPCYEGARRIWLRRVAAALDAGADGVDIRTFCHHNGITSWLAYAFAGALRDTFRGLYGREPRCEPADYGRVRRIRGDAYLEFLRDARKLASSRGKRLTMQFESGIEVPASLACRMQMSLDYERILRERLVDEVNLKWFTSQSVFAHEKVVPLARKHGIQVHVISRLWGALDHRGIEMAAAQARDARLAGFDGYNFYETANFIEMNPLGRPTPKGQAAQAIAAAAAEK